MTDAGHKEHSSYISHYPAAHETTAFQNPDGSSVIDLKYTDNRATGVAIQTTWTPSSIIVWSRGTKHVNVELVPEPGTTMSTRSRSHKPAGGACKPVQGKQGSPVSPRRTPG